MKKTANILASAALLLGTATAANANMVMYLDDLSTAGIDVILADGLGAGAATDSMVTTVADASATAGVLLFSGAVGSFVVNASSTGFSKPLLNGTTLMDLVNATVSGGAGTLEIGLTDTNFLGSLEGFTFNIGGTAAGSVTAQGFADDSNAEFGQADGSALLAFGAGAFSGSDLATLSPAVAAPYSLSIITSITHGTGTQVSSFDAEIKVPEPASLALFGLGLLGLGFSRRKIRK